MSIIAIHIRTVKRLLAFCFLLFALFPCTVKESLMGLVRIDYVKPTSRSQATSQNGFCNYTVATRKEVSVTNLSKIKIWKEPEFLITNFGNIFPNKTTASYSKTFSGNSPPKYILYKCLKLYIV